MWLTKMALLMQTRKHLFSGFFICLKGKDGFWEFSKMDHRNNRMF